MLLSMGDVGSDMDGINASVPERFSQLPIMLFFRRLQNSLSRNSGCTICTKKGRLATASGARFCMDWTDASVPERFSQLPNVILGRKERLC